MLCNEQGRFVESLEYYEQALRVREQSLGTSPERIGVLLNNIANTRRRMGKLDEAHRAVDRSSEFLQSEGRHALACSYGTKGLIFRDQGRDEVSVEWFRKSIAEHEMFYGDDAVTMLRAIQPLLVKEPLCSGGKIIVRQGDRHREVLLPGPVM